MSLDLSGRLEAARVTGQAKDTRAVGELVRTGEPVYISNGTPYIGETCLVRFDLLTPHEKMKRFNLTGTINYAAPVHRIGNFISSTVPDGFTGLGRDEFVLYAVWTGNMAKRCRFPTLDEINHYFEPGNLPGVPFFLDVPPHTEVIGANITPRGYWELWRHNTPQRYIQTKMNPDRGTRFVIAETPRALEHILAAIREIGLTPIEAEPMRLPHIRSLKGLATAIAGH